MRDFSREALRFSMLPLSFVAETVLISLSGVMAPGPISAVTVGRGNETPHAGIYVALGHGIVEFPLMIFLYLGFGLFLSNLQVKSAIALAGGLVLSYLSYAMFRDLKSGDPAETKAGRSPLISGALLSLGNPYFLVWWATVGVSLILRASHYGISGFTLFMVIHWMCDLVWLYFLSILAFKGGKVLGKTFRKVVLFICGTFLAGFAVKYLIDGARGLI